MQQRHETGEMHFVIQAPFRLLQPPHGPSACSPKRMHISLPNATTFYHDKQIDQFHGMKCLAHR